MTVKFKKPLKPVPGGWVAVDYETHGQKLSVWDNPEEAITQLYAEFKKQGAIKANPVHTLDNLLNELVPTPLVKDDSMYIYSIVILTTENETNPKWSVYDQWIGTTSNDFINVYTEYKEVQKQRLKDKSITGYKILSTHMGDNQMMLKFLTDYCETQYEPKPKVYINGPKKSNEFLTKNAKQYANAKNI